MRGYTTPDAVADLLGATFTPEQEAAVTARIEALEAHLDRTLRYRWLVPLADATVVHRALFFPPQVLLPVAPLATVTAVRLLPAWVGATPVDLVAGTDFAVESAAEAILWVVPTAWNTYRWGPRVEVTYAQPVDQALPADAAAACTRTVAVWTAPTLPAGAMSDAGGAIAAGAAGVKSYQVGQELRVEYQGTSSGSSGGSGSSGDAGLPLPVPAEAAAVLATYGYPQAARWVLA